VARRLLPLLLLAGAATITYWDVGVGLVRQWMTDDNYAHGFLVAPLAVYFAWRSRSALAACEVRPSAWGLLIVVCSLGLLVAGVAASEVFLARISLVGVIVGCTWYLLGAQCVRVLAFPLVFLLLMVPPPAIVLNEVTLPLQLTASTLGELVLRGAGIAVRREGNVLELASMQLEVAEACSGIRSLTMLMTFAIAFGRLCDYSPRRMWALAAGTIPIAVATNAARVAATGLAAHTWGKATADGFLHSASGTLAFAAALLVMLAVDRFVRPPARLATTV
jgi:exosortase